MTRKSFSTTQRGSTLLVSLLFLLILTILGLASVSTTGLQERMAHNTREQNLAFQAAEAALVDGENWLQAQRTIGAPTPAAACGGNCALVPVFQDNLPAHADIINQNYNWWQNNGRQHGFDPVANSDNRNLSIVNQQPYYLIQEINIANLPNLQPGSLGQGFEYGANDPRYYRIYAYGVGQASYGPGNFFNVLLESLYAIPVFN